MAHSGTSMGRKLLLTGILLSVLALAAAFFLPRDRDAGAGSALRVGAGDDITGVLLSEISACAEADGAGDALVGSYLFADCCSSAAQWALQAEEIDLGFYCAQAALAMVNQTDAFEIYSPAIMNSEVLAYLDSSQDLQSMGIPRKRSFLEDIARDSYPQLQSFSEINRTYLTYALETGDVDSVLLDVGDAARVEDDKIRFLPASSTPYISYCMVVRKDIEETKAFQQFLTYYEQAVDQLNDPEYLVQLLGKDQEFWDMTGLEFLYAV